ncbi:MAG TPA: NUDIX hydrolase [Xanthobacteraceae bacterium]|nr:NUDIX hydrolase [Xanthobacteraceae bacterium]
MNDLGGRLLERLRKLDNLREAATVRPRDAATMIIIDRSGRAPKVLLGRRHAGHKFMPGKFVFPGGRVEPLDGRVPSATPLEPRVEARLLQAIQRPSATRARAFALAAIRETFEETGIMLGTKSDTPMRSPGGPSGSPWDAFVQEGVAPDLAPVHFVARAITPPGRTKRFDARFFAVDADAIAARREGVVGPDTELTELVWLPITEAARLEMSSITIAMLEELNARIEAGFSHDLPVPYYRVLNRRRTRELL